jgi:ketosteroid isomerase-like protein
MFGYVTRRCYVLQMDDAGGADGVRHTLHAYCRRLDQRDLDTLLDEVYLPDAVDDRQRGTPLHGHDAIRDYFAAALSRIHATAHMLSNIDVLVQGSTARASSRVTAYHWTTPPTGAAQPADFVLLGTYDDDLTLTSHGWRISRRVVGALGPTGLAAGRLPEVFAGFGGAT